MKQVGHNGFSLKNKGSAVRFCLWPLGFSPINTKTAHTSAHTYNSVTPFLSTKIALK